LVPESALEEFVASLPTPGVFSVWCGPVEGDAWCARDEHLQHYAASTMKLALVMAAFREADAGRLDLDRQVEVHNDFRSVVDGSPYSVDESEDNDSQPWQRIGTRVALRWLAYRAIVRSSNLATNLLFEAVGAAPIAQLLGDLGASKSQVGRGIEDTRARDAGVDNLVTAADLARQLQGLYGHEVLGSHSSTEILDVLAAQQVNDAIPVGLPTGTVVAHKTGWVPGISHDAAIVGVGSDNPFIFVMCTTSELTESESLDLIARGARAAWADHGDDG
jgi:beta-lactamase class A